MATQTIWHIRAMNCYPNLENVQNAVFAIHWTCVATDGALDVALNAICVTPITFENFTPYDQLTQDQVLGWIWANGVDRTAVETLTIQQFDNNIDVSNTTNLPLPWITNDIATTN
jgi:hypothetical protein